MQDVKEKVTHSSDRAKLARQDFVYSTFRPDLAAKESSKPAMILSFAKVLCGLHQPTGDISTEINHCNVFHTLKNDVHCTRH